jgi:choline-sulfatase
VTLVASAAGLAVWWLARAPLFGLEPSDERNILLVTVDSLRADAVGAYGGRASTPNLDRLAARGARFTFAHAHAVVTLAAHGSILTGRYPYEHGLRDSAGYRLAPTEPTAATRLKQRGFVTGAFIGGSPLDRRFGLGIGFDVYDDRMAGDDVAGDFTMPARPAGDVVASAVKWIGGQAGRWFSWVHLFDPHAPHEPSAEWRQRYPNDPYFGEVSSTDAALGVLLNEVARQTRPTLIVVTADHGESLGEHGEPTHGLFAYESTLHVPLVVAELGGSRRTPRGLTLDGPVRHIDILPTFLDAIGAPGDAGLSGASLLPLIDGSVVPDRPSYFEAMTANLTRGWAPLRGVVANRQKYIDLPVTELYDLVDDPQEQRNILTLRTERGEVFLNTLKFFSTTAPNRPREETEAVRNRLRSLGYTGSTVIPTRDRYTDADDPKQLVPLEQAMHRAANAYMQGRASEAIAIYQGIVESRPNTADAYRRLAYVQWNSGDAAAAIATLEAAVKQGVTRSELRVRLAQYLSRSGRADRAVALLEGAAENLDALNELALAFAATGRSADAIQIFKQMLELDPDNAEAHANLGALQLRLRDLGAAEAALRRAIELDPARPAPHVDLGSVLAETGRTAEARSAWTRALGLSPKAEDVSRIRKLLDSAK